MATKELREERAKLISDARQLLDKAEGEKRDLTAEENDRFSKMHSDAEALRVRYERIEQQESLEGGLQQASERSAELQAKLGATGVPRTNDGADSAPSGSDHAMALQGWMRHQLGEEVSDSQQEAMQRSGVRLNQKAVELSLLPEHELRNVQAQSVYYRQGHFRNPQMVQTTTAPGGGGVLVPDGFIASVEQARLAFGSMFRTSEIMRTESGEPIEQPTMNDTSNKGELVASEETEVGTQDVSLGARVFNAYRYSSKMIRVSVTLLEDNAVNFASMIGAIAGERLGRIGEEHLTTGDGAAKPEGIVTGATVGKTAAAATSFSFDEIYDLVHSVDPAYRNGAQFMMHDNTLLDFKKIKDGNGRYMFQAGVSVGSPDTFDGHTININQEMASSLTASSKPIVFGDLRKYKIREVRSIRLRRLVERYAEFDQEGFVAFMRWDGKLMDAGTNPVKTLQMAAS